jgi:anti-sigma regulatory factor (Ser/Thr protein kinase)
MVRHNPGAGGRIDVELDLRDAELLIQLRDQDCARFDIRRDSPRVDPRLPLESRSPGGLGIHLVKALVDRIDYVHENRTGTIRLHKRLE